MAIFLPDLCRRNILKLLLGTLTTGNLVWHAYTNNYTPTAGDTLSNYTELSSGIYTPPSVAVSAFTVATAGGVTTMTAPQQNVAIAGACTIYGYYVTDSGGTNLLWVESFGANPISFGTGGGTWQIIPYLQDANI
jgi:hypothetical protein